MAAPDHKITLPDSARPVNLPATSIMPAPASGELIAQAEPANPQPPPSPALHAVPASMAKPQLVAGKFEVIRVTLPDSSSSVKVPETAASVEEPNKRPVLLKNDSIDQSINTGNNLCLKNEKLMVKLVEIVKFSGKNCIRTQSCVE